MHSDWKVQNLILFRSFFQNICNPMEVPLTEGELGGLAGYIEPNNQERVAQILHPEEGSTMIAFLKAEHRENVWGIGNDILQTWLRKNPPPGNRIVS